MSSRPSQPPLFSSDALNTRSAPSRVPPVKHYSNVRAAPAPRPWLCCVLAVDTAKHSGWAMRRDGELLDSGEVDTADSAALLAIVQDFVLASKEGTERARVLVLEKPWGGNAPTLIGLAMARERWLRAWKDAGEARMRVLSVHPSTWRAKTLGNVRGLKRDQIRERERRRATQISPKYTGDIGDDECAALCISEWSCFAAETGTKIGSRAVQSSMASWRTR